MVALACVMAGSAFADPTAEPSAGRDAPKHVLSFESYKPLYFIAQGGSADPRDGQYFYSKFQISLRQNLFYSLYLGFTEKAIWSMTTASAPIIDNNFNPEVFWDFTDRDDGQPKPGISLGKIGVEHESNGQPDYNYDSRGQYISRSWNRAYVWPQYIGENFSVSLKAWYILDEINSAPPPNPYGYYWDYPKYYGYSELHLGWRRFLGEEYLQAAVTARKGLLPYAGNVLGELFLRMPEKNWGVYFQVFNGYGETLLDYDKSTTRYGLGINLTDVWRQ